MALVRFGGGVTQMTGSIGGTTFARNRGGNYARARTKPVNPNSPLQVLVRSSLTFLTDSWAATLTAVQRTAWNLYASNVIMQNRLGESINLSGFNHYLRSNTTLKRTGLTLVQDGPTIFEIPDADPTFTFTGSEATQQITVTFDNTLAWANEDDGFLHVFQGQPQNAQRNFFAGPWRKRDSIAGDSGTPPTTPLVTGVAFAIAAGQHVWIYGRIQRADGRLSAPFRDDVFISA